MKHDNKNIINIVGSTPKLAVVQSAEGYSNILPLQDTQCVEVFSKAET